LKRRSSSVSVVDRPFYQPRVHVVIPPLVPDAAASGHVTCLRISENARLITPEPRSSSGVGLQARDGFAAVV